MMDDKQTEHGQRVAKAIARSGLASRREAEGWIAAGRVAINGEVIHSPAHNVGSRDRVTVDGEPLPVRERTRLFLYHKPRGLLTTRIDPQGRPTIFERLPKQLPRLISVGRLDFNTEGLLLLTNDGALARLLELPTTGWLRRYRVRAHGAVTQQQLDALRAGLTVEGIHYGPIDAKLDRVQGSNVWLTFAMREGKNREVRKVLATLELTVTRLIRVSFGPFQLGELAQGAIEEVRTRTLREQLGPRLAALSGADFSSPRGPAEPHPQPKDGSERPPPRAPASHAWRAADAKPAKPLRRKFHGSRRDITRPHEPPVASVRSEVLTDRKGRPIMVERHGRTEAAAPPPKAPKLGAFKRNRRRAGSDRASGPRPSRPSRPARPRQPRRG